MGCRSCEWEFLLSYCRSQTTKIRSLDDIVSLTPLTGDFFEQQLVNSSRTRDAVTYINTGWNQIETCDHGMLLFKLQVMASLSCDCQLAREKPICLPFPQKESQLLTR